MESYIQAIRNNKKDDGRANDDKLFNLTLPEFDLMKSQLQANQSECKINLDFSKQIHMIFTTRGLLFYVPKEDDASYVIMDEYTDAMDANQKRQVRLNNAEKRSVLRQNDFGSFEATYLLPFDKGAKNILKDLLSGFKRFMTTLNASFKGHSRIDKDIVKKLRKCGSANLTRQLSFIASGALCYSSYLQQTLKKEGVLPPIELYQHLLDKLPTSVICEGAGYRGTDESEYKKKRIDDMCTFTKIKLVDGDFDFFLTNVKRFDFMSESYAKTGQSVMVTSGAPRKSTFVNTCSRATNEELKFDCFGEELDHMSDGDIVS
ncbi:protein 9 [Thyrinteina arnobia cypovirus 14]|nr:protein 9 [Thyrinteina arnobia cypovirus 14]